MSTSTGIPPASATRLLYITKYGSKRITSSPGLTARAERQEQAPRGARGDQHLAVGVAELGVDGGLDLAPQLGEALGEGVGVVPALDRRRSRRP